MRPSYRYDPPPNFPKPPGTRTTKIIVLVGLLVVYVGGYQIVSHWPARKLPPQIVTIPVDVVKWKQRVPAPPALRPRMETPAPVVIPPPRLLIRTR
ncbi:hypothetical protein [Acetobacter oeni]|uniref:Uncharacterized protein n=1 Tax=Acetobacter oeni TaxID=304077 RepID=A0A511XN59_9PROT|nr:hypothetical protein [Acetobacter oeni]MBB3884215.1 hypothetical protein [Acetobacter oeni]NHO20191.1 hypothetical protein [Acetobacter oeni]GEN64366.1 hypothetical protein AOE01nite_25900 [Acetobacter oeni]